MNILQNKITSLNIGLSDIHNYSKFNIDNVTFGFMQNKFVDALRPYRDVFSIKEEDGTGGIGRGRGDSLNSRGRPEVVEDRGREGLSVSRTVELHPNLLRYDLHDRTVAVATVLEDLRSKGMIRGWRNELFPIVSEFGESKPALLIERACYPWFGIKGYGLHVNGYTVSAGSGSGGGRSSSDDDSGSYISHYWVAKRAMTKSTFPGALDSIVAGAIPFGVSSLDNLAKECLEEARIPPEVSMNSCVPTGCVNYVDKDSDGNLKRDFLLCFDFKTPTSFVPEPNDGEVENFRLMPVDWLINEVLKTDDDTSSYKPNCVIIIVDFLIRRGIISPDSPGYFKLVGSLRGGYDCA